MKVPVESFKTKMKPILNSYFMHTLWHSIRENNVCRLRLHHTACCICTSAFYL